MLSLRPFRDAISKLSLRKKLVILASVGVLLPVLVLTYLQYRSLTGLQNKTKGAFKDNLRQGLTYVEQQMKQRLKDTGDQTLDPLANMHVEEFEKHFASVKRTHSEIEQILSSTTQALSKRRSLTFCLYLTVRGCHKVSLIVTAGIYSYRTWIRERICFIRCRISAVLRVSY